VSFAGLLAYIPSPPRNGISLGPLRLHVYGLLIALGVVAAVWLSQRRWSARGGEPGTMAAIAVWGVPAGLIGARLYSVITSWHDDTGGHWYKAFEIWDGGLGIWGGIFCGVIFGVIGAMRKGVDWRSALDCVTPALPLAQAVGRWGNYFNQELYGRRSGLPWAVKIDHPAPVGSTLYAPGTTFQPTFLYECLWDLACVGLLLLAERHVRIRKGYLVALYAALYCVGRFWIEYLRIDDAKHYWGLRLNDWTSIVVFSVAVVVLITRGRADPSDPLDPPAEPAVEPDATDPATAR
jgi:prolipoprotein diacylglyceryl transferase